MSTTVNLATIKHKSLGCYWFSLCYWRGCQQAWVWYKKHHKSLFSFSGLWFDLEVSYTGSFLMTLETKMNLARLGKEGEGLGEHGKDWWGFKSAFLLLCRIMKLSEARSDFILFLRRLPDFRVVLHSLSWFLRVCFSSYCLILSNSAKIKCVKDSIFC